MPTLESHGVEACARSCASVCMHMCSRVYIYIYIHTYVCININAHVYVKCQVPGWRKAASADFAIIPIIIDYNVSKLSAAIFGLSGGAG